MLSSAKKAGKTLLIYAVSHPRTKCEFSKATRSNRDKKLDNLSEKIDAEVITDIKLYWLHFDDALFPVEYIKARTRAGQMDR